MINAELPSWSTLTRFSRGIVVPGLLCCDHGGVLHPHRHASGGVRMRFGLAALMLSIFRPEECYKGKQDSKRMLDQLVEKEEDDGDSSSCS